MTMTLSPSLQNSSLLGSTVFKLFGRGQRRTRSTLLAAATTGAALWTGTATAAGASGPGGIMIGAVRTYATTGCAFQAVPLPSGQVLVSVENDSLCQPPAGTIPGIELFEPVEGPALKASCTAPQPVDTAGATFEPALARLYNNHAGLAVGAEQAGAVFYRVNQLTACRDRDETADQRLPQLTPAAYAKSDPGTFGVAVTRDAREAFVANEYGIGTPITVSGQAFTVMGSVGVTHLPGVFGRRPKTAAQLLVGGNAIAGIHLTRDGTRLYVTTEIAWPGTKAAGSANPTLAHTGCFQQAGEPATANGTLTVIDVPRLLADAAAAAKATSYGTTPVLVPASIVGTVSLPGAPVFPTHAILATINAGCSPVRIVEAADHSALFVSARGDNTVLAFSPKALEAETAAETAGISLIGAIGTGGVAPVGLALLHSDEFLAVANSNRFAGGAPGSVTVLQLTKAASGLVSGQVVQTIDKDGLFPREITVAPDDSTFYVTNYNSRNFLVVPTKLQ